MHRLPGNRVRLEPRAFKCAPAAPDHTQTSRGPRLPAQGLDALLQGLPAAAQAGQRVWVRVGRQAQRPQRRAHQVARGVQEAHAACQGWAEQVRPVGHPNALPAAGPSSAAACRLHSVVWWPQDAAHWWRSASLGLWHAAWPPSATGSPGQQIRACSQERATPAVGSSPDAAPVVWEALVVAPDQALPLRAQAPLQGQVRSAGSGALRQAPALRMRLCSPACACCACSTWQTRLCQRGAACIDGLHMQRARLARHRGRTHQDDCSA